MTTSELIIFLFSCAVISVLRFLLSSREGGEGGWGYSLQWPIQGGSSRKWYLLHGFKYMKGRAFTI